MEELNAQAAFAAALADCLALHDTPGFWDPFLRVMRSTGADQIMVFSYAPGHASCLLSRNYTEDLVGRRLASDYLNDWFLSDPLYPRALDLPVGSLELHRMDALLPAMTEDYRARFFATPRIVQKVTALLVGRHRLAVSLYWRKHAEPAPETVRLIARLVQLHVEATPASEIPRPLEVLSARERSVCLGILAGKKAEQIAHELGLKPTSVATYRTRAYQKLGINSRGALFAICRA